MSTLLGKLIKDSYGDLLQISNSNYGIDATSRYIEDGEGTPSVLSLSTTRVGIGTDSPDEELHILAPAQPYLKIEATDASESGVLLARQSMNTWRIINKPEQSDSLAIQGNGATIDQFVTITQTGRVGIGTTDPAVNLHIGTATSDSQWIRLGTQYGDFSIGNGSHNTPPVKYFSIYDNDAEQHRLFLSDNGNIGIGTTNPTAKLDIFGDSQSIKFTRTQGDRSGEILYDGSVFLIKAPPSDRLSIADSSSSELFTVNPNSGNVGIGTTNPRRRFTIAGGHLLLLSDTDLTANDGNQYRQAIGWSAAASSDVMNSFINCEDVGNWGGKMHFWTRGEFGGEAVRGMTILGGHVGIGDSDPGSALSILNTSTASVDAITLKYEHLSSASGLEQRIKWRFGDDATSDAPSDAGYIAMGKANAWQTAASRSSYISFATVNGLNQAANGGSEPDYTPVERMRITQEGKVGIGTTNPDQLLQVSSKTNVAARFNMIDGSFSNWLTIGCSVGSASTKFTSSTDGFHFDTGDAAGANALIINQDGKVGIGVDYSEIVSKTYRLHVNGTLKIYGTSYVDSTAITSDDRVKHNEQDIVGAIDTLSKITPKKYIKTSNLYNADHNFELDMNGNPVDEHGDPVECSIEAGVIAQQVLDIPELAFTVIPEDVDQDGNVTSPHSLNYNSLFTYAIAAIQEQQSIITELKSRIQSLEQQQNL